MSRAVAWFQALSVRYQVALGVALGVALATLAFGLIAASVLQRAIRSTEQERLAEAQRVAVALEPTVRRGLEQGGDQRQRLEGLLAQAGAAQAFAFTLINDRGDVLATTSEWAAGGHDPHLELMADLVKARRPGSRIHRVASGAHVVAFAPLAAGGGVLMEQLDDRALAVPLGLLRILPYFGLAVLVVAHLVTWLHVSWALRPLGQLERAAARIARGNLDEPVVVRRRDEIGRLARSFDRMRAQLKEVGEARAQWEQELERQVQARTAEAQRLAARIVTAQEEERRRLAQELHDDTAQALATLLIGMEALGNSLPADQERLRQRLSRTLEQGHRALEDLRRVILGLRPAAVDNLGLVAALRSYAAERLSGSGTHLDFAVQGQERRLSEPVEAALFRILQEGVNNAARHARAQNIRVRLDFQDAWLLATVEDDGRGFVASEVEAGKGGLGLAGMRERAEIMHARLEVTSAPGRGTRVMVELPLEKGVLNGAGAGDAGR